jgi:hypothetical protein
VNLEAFVPTCERHVGYSLAVRRSQDSPDVLGDGAIADLGLASTWFPRTGTSSSSELGVEAVRTVSVRVPEVNTTRE